MGVCWTLQPTPDRRDQNLQPHKTPEGLQCIVKPEKPQVELFRTIGVSTLPLPLQTGTAQSPPALGRDQSPSPGTRHWHDYYVPTTQWLPHGST